MFVGYIYIYMFFFFFLNISGLHKIMFYFRYKPITIHMFNLLGSIGFFSSDRPAPHHGDL